MTEEQRLLTCILLVLREIHALARGEPLNELIF